MNNEVMNIFKPYRFNDETHLGLGDIRLSIGAQEEIADEIQDLINSKIKEALAEGRLQKGKTIQDVTMEDVIIACGEEEDKKANGNQIEIIAEISNAGEKFQEMLDDEIRKRMDKALSKSKKKKLVRWSWVFSRALVAFLLLAIYWYIEMLGTK